MHRRRRSLTHHSLNPDSDAAIQSSPPPDDAISYASLRNLQHSPHSNHSLLASDGDIPPMFDDLPLNEPFKDVQFAQSPERGESPLDENYIYHPLINGM